MEKVIAYAIRNTSNGMWIGNSWEEKSLHRAKFYQSLENAELYNPKEQRERLHHEIVEVEIKVRKK